MAFLSLLYNKSSYSLANIDLIPNPSQKERGVKLNDSNSFIRLV